METADVKKLLEAKAVEAEGKASKEDKRKPESAKRLNVIYGCQMAAQYLRDVIAKIEQNETVEELTT